MDMEIRKKAVAKLKKSNKSRQQLIADLKQGHTSIVQDARALDINLDAYFDMISPGKESALQAVLEDLDIAMIDTTGRPSSQVGEFKGLHSLADECAAAYIQRLYTIGSRFPNHPLVATFTLSPIAGGTVFNPFSATPVREQEEIQPEIDYTNFLAESWSTLDDTARIPLYEDDEIDRRKRRVSELAEIEIMKFNFSEDAKAIYKYGCGIQWSYETAFREVRMQLLGTWVMRQAITDRMWMLMDALGVAIDFAHAKGRTYDIAAGGHDGQWTWDKLEDNNERWRVPYMYDWIICSPVAKRKFKETNWGSNNWTIGHLMALGGLFNTNYEDADEGGDETDLRAYPA